MLESRHIPEHFIPIPTLIFYLQFLRFQYNLYMSNPKFAEQTIVYDIKKMVSQNIETIICPICMESISTPKIIITKCNHSFCDSCITEYIHMSHTTRCVCPMCRDPIKKMTRPITKP